MGFGAAAGRVPADDLAQGGVGFGAGAGRVAADAFAGGDLGASLGVAPRRGKGRGSTTQLLGVSCSWSLLRFGLRDSAVATAGAEPAEPAGLAEPAGPSASPSGTHPVRRAMASERARRLSPPRCKDDLGSRKVYAPRLSCRRSGRMLRRAWQMR